MKIMATYKITNTANGRIYIGSTINYKNRVSVHRYQLKNGTHGNHRLQQDAIEFGYSVFTFDALELFPDESNLIEAEQLLIDTLNPYYNIAKNASGCFGVIAREETRAKLSLSRSGDKNPWFGKVPPCNLLPKSDSTRAKISASKSGSKNPMHGITPAHAKLSSDDVRDIRKMSDYGFSYSSLANEYAVSKGCIASIIKRRTYRGVI